MKKITKLLSALLVMGAVGAGTAALTGCGDAPAPHTHNATKVAAVAATCEKDGNIEYYTCDGEDCKDKYFKDNTCTETYTAEEIKVAKRGAHEFKYADKGDGTHGKTCEHGDFTEEVAEHVDEKVNETGAAGKDDLCDFCGAKFFAPGKYYNATYEDVVEIKPGKVVYKDKEAALSAVSEENAATFTVEDKEYTLTKTEDGYTLSWDFVLGEETTTVERKLVVMPEIVVTLKKEFAGVYTSATPLVYKDPDENLYKVNKFEIDEEGKVLYEVVRVDKEDGTNEEGNTYVPFTDLIDQTTDVKFNVINGAPFTFTALTAGAATMEVKYVELDGTERKATFTKDAQAAAPVIPATLPVIADGEMYKDADGLYSLNNISGYYYLNYNQIYLLKEETVEGNKVYLVRGLDIYNDKVNYKLTFVTADEVTTVKLAAADGTELATLSLYVREVKNLVADGATENKAPYDEGSGYAFFKVTKTGWYVFSTTEANKWTLTIFTKMVDVGSPDVSTGTFSFFTSLTTKPVYLTEGQEIATNAEFGAEASYPFTATYSETEPEPDWQAFTDGSYTVNSFNSANEYYVKGVAAANGKYVVSVSTSTYYADRGAYFQINNVKYGYKYDGLSFSQYESLTYTADLVAGDEVKIRFGCENTWLPLGNVTVYFETKAEYDARIAAESTPPTFTSEQKATYTGSYYLYGDPMSATLVVGDDGITFNGTAMTFVKAAGTSYIYKYDGDKITVVTFNENGSLSFKDSANYVDFTAFKEVPFDGFTKEQQGVYSYSGKHEAYGFEYTITLTVSEKALSYAFDTTGRGEPTNLKFMSLEDGVYVWRDDNGYTITFIITAAGIEVTEDKLNNFVNEYTAVKGGASTGGDAEEQSNVAKDGLNTVTCGITNSYEMTLNLSGVWTITGGDNFSAIMLASNPREEVTEITVENAPVTFIVTAVDGSAATTFTLTLKSGTGEEVTDGGEEEQVNTVLSLNENTVKVPAGEAGLDYTFTAPEAGDYTISFDENGYVIYNNNGVMETLSNSGKDITLTENQTITLNLSRADMTAGTFVLTITKK